VHSAACSLSLQQCVELAARMVADIVDASISGESISVTDATVIAMPLGTATVALTTTTTTIATTSTTMSTMVIIMPTTTKPETVNTKLTSAAKPGDTELQVDDTKGFAKGDTIVLSPGSEIEEKRVIIGFGSIILSEPLEFGHSTGESVQKVSESTTSPGDADGGDDEVGEFTTMSPGDADGGDDEGAEFTTMFP